MWQNRKRDKKALDSGISMEEQERVGRKMGEQNKMDIFRIEQRQGTKGTLFLPRVAY